MIKLYKLAEGDKLYWETWENDGVHTIHWGNIGTKGESRELKSGLFSNPKKKIQQEITEKISDGYAEIEEDEQFTLMIEYAVNGMGTAADLDKRNDLQSRMDNLLGWTGLGHCDGGSIGSGTMEVCCYVVDFNIAKALIEIDLKGTEFEHYTRIYDENAG